MKTREGAGPVRLLSVQDVADLLQVPVGTIYHWRCVGVGPKSMRMGRHVRFHPVDVADWLDDRREVT